MPTYEYLEEETGGRVERIVPIAERDKQPGLRRILVPRRVAFVGVAPDIHDMGYLTRESLKDMETRYGRDAIRRDTGMTTEQLKSAWAA